MKKIIALIVIWGWYYEVKTEIASLKKLIEFIVVYVKWRKNFKVGAYRRARNLIKMNRYELWKELP